MIARGDGWRIVETLDWLIAEGRFAPDFDAFVEATGRRLIDDGAAAMRFRLAYRTLHPLVTAVSCMWRRGARGVERNEAANGLETRGAYLGGPMQRIAEGGAPYRRRLEDDLGDDDHSFLQELKSVGATDYYGCALPFATDGSEVMVVTGDAPGGFSNHEIAGFAKFAAALSPLVEIERLKQVSARSPPPISARAAQRPCSADASRAATSKPSTPQSS